MSKAFRCRSVFMACVIAVLLASCSASVEVVSGLHQIEANEVFSVLLNAGLHVAKTVDKEGLSTITVDQNQVTQAIDLLRSRGLPRENFQGLGHVFKKEGMVSSPVEERARYLFALSEELSETLSNIDGVVVARVHLVLPEHNAFTDTTTPSSAAVFIKYDKTYNIDILQPQIKRLVASSIPGLAVDRVSVVLVPGQDYSGQNKKHAIVLSSDGTVSAVKEEAPSFFWLDMLVLSMFVIAVIGILLVLYWLLYQRKKKERE